MYQKWIYECRDTFYLGNVTSYKSGDVLFSPDVIAVERASSAASRKRTKSAAEKLGFKRLIQITVLLLQISRKISRKCQ